MGRPSWGHTSRYCVRCGKVGPRTIVLGGWAHSYCLTSEEKRERRRKAAERRAGPAITKKV